MLERKLSKFLLPGPFAYCPVADLFVTYCSRMELEGYKYASLAAQPQGGQVYTPSPSPLPLPAACSDLVALAAMLVHKKSHADWSVIVGEEVVSIELGRLSRALPASQASRPPSSAAVEWPAGMWRWCEPRPRREYTPPVPLDCRLTWLWSAPTHCSS